MSLKSPADIANSLLKQWLRTDKRLELLSDETPWPIQIRIGKPTAHQMRNDLTEVKEFLEKWRTVKVGRVNWAKVGYRGLAETLEIPESLELASLEDWIESTGNQSIQSEFRKLREILENTDPVFQPLLIRRRQLINSMKVEDCLKAIEVASLLSPGCAKGIPLRGISLAGIDTKFIENHQILITGLLDIRFPGTVKTEGLEKFLGTIPSDFHWLLVVDLDGRLLPMERIRVRDTEMLERELPGKRILIVENEQCLHLIPKLEDTIAILGAGLNLSWLSAPWLSDRILGYWGDIDTWGLTMLATARLKQPGVSSLLMNEATFTRFENKGAVAEPVHATSAPPRGLKEEEKLLYSRLIATRRGRLEQEFLSREVVQNEMYKWVGSDSE